jgi:hypothetical protein
MQARFTLEHACTCSEGNVTACPELFCPLYSAAVAPDPLLGNQSDIFLAGRWGGASFLPFH